MKYLIIFLSALFVISCGGESLEEKNKKIEQENTRIENIKLSTCAVLKETTEEQNAFRVKELNSARASIGQEPFIEGDKVILNAIKFGLCESLVGNDANFNQQFAYQKDLHISQICEELNLSYAPKEITEENHLELFWGVSFDEKFIESINLQKMSMVEAFRINFNLPSFHGSHNDINKFQFLGLCKELLIDDSNAITKRLNAYDKIIKMDTINNSDGIILNSNKNFVTNKGEIYFEKLVRSNNESKRSFINLDTLEEITNLKFDGILQMVDPEYLITTTVKFENQNGKFISDYKSYYHNGDLKSLRTNDSIQFWYFNRQLRQSVKLKNDLPEGDFIVYEPNGEILKQLNYVKGKKEGLAISYGIDYCYKNDKKVDLEECK